MKHYLIADRYARSLGGAIADDGQLEPTLDGLHEISALLSDNHELHSILTNPAISVKRRVAILNAILERLDVAPIINRLLETLVRRGRITLLPEVTELFARLADQRLMRLTARVTSAVPLTGDQTQLITASLEKFSGMHVRVRHAVDPEILGGIIARIGGKIIDGSMRTRIERLKQSLLPEENLGG